MNSRILTPIKDESSQNASRNPESFLDSLGFGSDALEGFERSDPDSESNDGLMLSSQPDEISLPGLRGYQIPKRFGLEDLRPAVAQAKEETPHPAVKPELPTAEAQDSDIPCEDVEAVPASDVEEPSSSPIQVSPAEEIIDSSVSFSIPPTARVAESDREEPQDPEIETPTPEEEGIAEDLEDPTEPAPTVGKGEIEEVEVEEEETDPSLYLSCPKCDGELILQPEHLGIQGNCVWCEIPIVAAKSAADSSVHIFALENPKAEAPEPEETESIPAESTDSKPPMVAETTEDAVEQEEEVVLPYQPELPENVVAAEVEIPGQTPPAVNESPPIEVESTPLPVAPPKKSEPHSEEAPQEPSPIFFADTPTEFAAPATVVTAPPTPSPATTPDPAKNIPAQVSPFSPAEIPPVAPPQDAESDDVVLPALGPLEHFAPTVEPVPETLPPAEAQVSPFSPAAPAPEAIAQPEPTAAAQGPIASPQVSPFGEPVATQEVEEVSPTATSQSTPPITEEPEPEISTGLPLNGEGETMAGPPSPWGQPFQTPDTTGIPTSNEASPPSAEPDPSSPAKTPATLNDLAPVVPETPPVDDDGFRIAPSDESGFASPFADLPSSSSSPAPEDSSEVVAAEPTEPEIPTTFQSPFAPAPPVDAPLAEAEAAATKPPEPAEEKNDSATLEKPLLYDPDDPDLPPEDPPKKKRKNNTSSGFSPDNPPPPPGSLVEGTGSASPPATPVAFSANTPSNQKSGKNLSVLLVIMGLVTGVCVASFLLPMEEYISKARGYVDDKFGQKVAVPLVKPGGHSDSGSPPKPGGAPASLPTPPQPKPPTSP